MALAEVAPEAEPYLHNGLIQYPLLAVDRAVIRRGCIVASIAGSCDACFAHNIGSCLARSLPPYVDDCGRDRSVA